MKNNITWFNRNFRFVYTMSYEQILNNFCQIRIPRKVRFLVGAGSLSKWITDKNAETVLKTAKNMKTDKTTIKFRKYGKIEIYTK